MTSRSATVLVIFIIAIFAFCLASVFAAMTGPISILPQESDSGGILDNLSAITDEIDDNDNSYGYQQYNDYSSNNYYDDSGDDSSNIETTTDDSSDTKVPEKKDTSGDIETTTDNDASKSKSKDSNSKSSSDIETTTDG